MKFLPTLGASALVLVTAISGAPVLGPDPVVASSARTRRAETFGLASFNVLGSSHTGAHSGVRRSRGVVRLLRSHRVSIAGLQEFEKIQYRTFVRLTHHRWGVVSVPRGKGRDTRNAIVYRRSRFRLLSSSWVSIPYYGPEIRVPVARLRSRRTGKVFYVMNTHNAADVHGPAWRKRRVAVNRQVQRLTRMRRQGATVIFTGDMNDRRGVHCAVTRGGLFRAASGGSVGRRCRAPRSNGIDWIFGSRDVRFSRWVSDRSRRERRVSDHPFVVVRVRMHR